MIPRRRFLSAVAAVALCAALPPLPQLHAWTHGQNLTPFAKTLQSFGPSGLWQLNEAAGASSFADVSGNGLTLSPAGTLLPGLLAIIPGAAWGRSVLLSTTGVGTGALQCASTSTFNYSALTAMTGVLTFSMPKSVPSATLFSKFDASISRGFYCIMFPNTVEFAVMTDGSNYRKWQCAVPIQGIQNIFVSWNGNPATLPIIKLNGVAKTVTLAAGPGTPTTLSNSIPFTIGGRSDGLFWPGLVQCGAFYSGIALTGGNGDTIWAAHEVPDTSFAFSHNEDTDQGSSDRGDYQSSCVMIRRNAVGTISLKGSMTTCGDVVSAPAGRAIYDYYGLTGMPVGAYQGTDCHVGGTAGTPARFVRDQFRPNDTRANPIYTDPTVFYPNIFNAVADNSHSVHAGGFLNSIAQWLATGSAAVTLWNQKLRFLVFAAGQFPNSPTTASPAGNFLSTGAGEWNAGGSDASSVGSAEAAAFNLVLANTTKPVYLVGIEICGNSGNTPPFSDFINCSMPGWGAANPIAFGGSSGTGGVWTRTAWDYVGADLAMQVGVFGESLPFYSLNQIAIPVISAAAATAGQNTSVPGSSNVKYITPKLVAGQTLPQWRSMVALYLEAQVPYA